MGALLGGCVVLADTHRRTKQVKEGKKKLEDFEPEDRLFLAMIGGIGFAVSKPTCGVAQRILTRAGHHVRFRLERRI